MNELSFEELKEVDKKLQNPEIKKYLVMTKNKKITADEVKPGDYIFMHVDRWNGSYFIEVLSSFKKDNFITITDRKGISHNVPTTLSVWLREYAYRCSEC